ncbi:TPA: hypothetical protein L4T47_001164 [Pseudomonas aeruginosa]|nr:hypothetical protein [Pseudomonas aeruginosa]
MRSFLRGARESVRRLVAFAQAEGWSVDRSAGGHLKLSKIGCASIFISSTPSDARGELNARALLHHRADRQSSLNQESF